MKTTVKPKLIIDTDPGHDDMLAILLLLRSDRFDVQAITTVAGNLLGQRAAAGPSASKGGCAR
jgi:inosine-uridine nucleoside N-ribohydrolase